MQLWTNPWLKLNAPIVAAIRALAPSAQVSFAGNSDQQMPFRTYAQQEIEQAAALTGRSDVAVVVIIESGNPVLMPWKDRVATIVEAWYPGEGGGLNCLPKARGRRYRGEPVSAAEVSCEIL